MYCKNCGAEIQEGQKFCPKCGTPVNKRPEGNGKQPEQQTTPGNSNTASPSATPTKTRNTRMIIAIVAAVVLVGVVIFLIGRVVIKPTINLDDYTIVNFYGYDGYGTAKVYIDYSAIQKDYGEKVEIKEGNSSQLHTILGKDISLSVDKDSDLTNDEKITVSYTVDEEALKEAVDCSIKYETKEYTVSGLEIVGIVDVFDDLDIEFGGTAPFAYVDGYAQTYNSYCWYSADKSTGLSNGDEVTITINIDDMADFIETYGGLPVETEKTYTVSGLQSWVMDFSQLSDDDLNKMKSESDKKDSEVLSDISANFEEAGTSVVSGNDLKLNNVYFILDEEETDSNPSDLMFEYSFSYQRKVDATGELRDSNVVDFYVCFDQLVIEADGTLTGTEAYDIDTGSAYKNAEKQGYTIKTYDADFNEVN